MINVSPLLGDVTEIVGEGFDGIGIIEVPEETETGACVDGVVMVAHDELIDALVKGPKKPVDGRPLPAWYFFIAKKVELPK